MKNGALAVLMFAGSAYCIWTVIDGFRSGMMEPLSRGSYFKVERKSYPRWFWVAVAWNALWGAGCLFIGIKLIAGLSNT